MNKALFYCIIQDSKLLIIHIKRPHSCLGNPNNDGPALALDSAVPHQDERDGLGVLVGCLLYTSDAADE